MARHNPRQTRHDSAEPHQLIRKRPRSPSKRTVQRRRSRRQLPRLRQGRPGVRRGTRTVLCGARKDHITRELEQKWRAEQRTVRHWSIAHGAYGRTWRCILGTRHHHGGWRLKRINGDHVVQLANFFSSWICSKYRAFEFRFEIYNNKGV
jgi:hypothetical protein